jgi:hypothetical protein
MVVAGVSGSGVTSGLAAAGCVIGGGAAAGPLVLALGPAAVSIAAIAKEEPRQRLAAARDRADNAEIRTRLYRFYSWCADAKIPELTRLATTIETWWPAILAVLHTGLTNARSEGQPAGQTGQTRSLRLPQHRELTPPDTLPLHPRPAGQHRIHHRAPARLISKPS